VETAVDLRTVRKTGKNGCVGGFKEKVGISDEWKQLEGVGSLIYHNDRRQGWMIADKPWCPWSVLHAGIHGYSGQTVLYNCPVSTAGHGFKPG